MRLARREQVSAWFVNLEGVQSEIRTNVERVVRIDALDRDWKSCDPTAHTRVLRVRGTSRRELVFEDCARNDLIDREHAVEQIVWISTHRDSLHQDVSRLCTKMRRFGCHGDERAVVTDRVHRHDRSVTDL